MKTLLDLLKIPALLAAIAEFLRWLLNRRTITAAETQHAQNQTDIDTDYNRALQQLRDSPANTPDQPSPAPPQSPPVSSSPPRGP